MRLRNIPGADAAITESVYCIKSPETHKGHWQEIFPSQQPLHIEIGMGKGRFMMDLAAAHPDINYLGIERYSSVLLRALQKMEENPLPNLFFICMDAADVAEVFDHGEVDRIYFFNPFSIEILKKVLARVLESYYENPRELLLFFYYPSDEYISYLMTVDELIFSDEIDCKDLFPGENKRERIVVFEVG